MKYNLEQLRRLVLNDLENLLRKWYPAGVFAHGRFELGDISGGKGQSLKITLHGASRGMWFDFNTHDGGDIFNLWAANNNCDFAESIKQIAEKYGVQNKSYTARNEIFAPPDESDIPTAAYHYYTAEGELYCSQYKFIKNGKKTFLPWDAREKKHVFPKQRILYNLPSLTWSDEVIIVEGEKCADTLKKHGYAATTLMGGANAPIDQTDISPLKGKKRIVIWGDNDEAGEKYVKSWIDALKTLGVKNVVVTPKTPDKPDKWDVADAVIEGFDIDGHIRKASLPIRGRINIRQIPVRDFTGQPKPAKFLVDNLFPLGNAGILAAMGDTGKGILTLDLAVKVASRFDYASDDQMFLGNPVMEHGSVVIFTAEDSKDEIHRRLHRLDTNHVLASLEDRLMIVPLPDMGGPFGIAENVKGTDNYQLTDEYLSLVEQLERIDDLALVVFDPLTSLAGIDVNADPKAGTFVTGHLASLASRTGATVLAVHHIRKTGQIESVDAARESIRGTSAIVDGVRFAYVIWAGSGDDTDTMFKSMDEKYRPNAVFNGSIVKSNFDADRTIRRLLRNKETGLLEDKTNLIKADHKSFEELIPQLVDAIEKAALDGAPFGYTGSSGVYECRHRLPDPLSCIGRKKLRLMTEKALQDNLIKKCITKGSTLAKWLDVPTGPFATGEGEIKKGAAENVLSVATRYQPSVAGCQALPLFAVATDNPMSERLSSVFAKSVATLRPTKKRRKTDSVAAVAKNFQNPGNVAVHKGLPVTKAYRKGVSGEVYIYKYIPPLPIP